MEIVIYRLRDRFGNARRALQVLQRRLPVPDPRRAVLEQAVADACSVGVAVHNSDGPSWPGRSSADGADGR